MLAVVVAAGLTLNFMMIAALPFVAQVGVVWGELLIAFLAFFYSFDLSFPFISARLPILIFTGAFTTIYVSLISIGFACVLALIGALARLSKDKDARDEVLRVRTAQCVELGLERPPKEGAEGRDEADTSEPGRLGRRSWILWWSRWVVGVFVLTYVLIGVFAVWPRK